MSTLPIPDEAVAPLPLRRKGKPRPQPHRIPPVFVLLENGTAVAMTQDRREADNWLFSEEQEYVAYESLESIPMEMRLAILAQRVKTVESRLERAQASVEHYEWRHSLVRRILEKEPPNPVDPYHHERRGRRLGGFLSQCFNWSGTGFWPSKRK